MLLLSGDLPMSLFIKGLIVGFCLAAPVGPIAALCVQRTISKRFLSGLMSGLGAAAADAFYGAVAAFGATIVSEFLISERSWMQRVGGVILIFMGLRLAFSKPPRESGKDGETRSVTASARRKRTGTTTADSWAISSRRFFLTLTNPMTFVAFAAVFATMGIGAVRGRPFLTAELVGGVLLGSQIWWTILCGGAHALRRHFDYRKLITINRATGIFVIGVGVVYLFLGVEKREPNLPLPVPGKQHTKQTTPLYPLGLRRVGAEGAATKPTPDRAPQRLPRLRQRPLERSVDAERDGLLEARPAHRSRRIVRGLGIGLAPARQEVPRVEVEMRGIAAARGNRVHVDVENRGSERRVEGGDAGLLARLAERRVEDGRVALLGVAARLQPARELAVQDEEETPIRRAAPRRRCR